MGEPKFSKRLVALIILIIPALLQAFPIFYLISIAMKQPQEVFAYPPALIPSHLYFGNFEAAWQAAPLGRFLINSMIAAGCITILQCFTAILAAFALSRLQFWGSRAVFILVIATMLVPGEITIIPNYLTILKLGWVDTYKGLIIPFTVSGFGVFLLYQFFKTIPKELEEAVLIDGGSKLRFLFQFMVPLSWPSIIGFAVYAFVGAWNQYLWPLIATQSTEMRTVQIGIGMFRSQNESSSWGIIMAATLILIAPSVIVFLVSERQFIRGMTMSGLKG